MAPDAPPGNRDGTRRERQVPRRVFAGTALQVGGRLFGSACTFATLVLLARGLPDAEFGRFTFYLALFGVLDALADFGTGQAAVQLTADRPDALGPVLVRARRVRLATSFAGVVGLAVYALARGETGAGWIVLAGLYPVTHALELTATVFRNRIAWRVPVVVRALASSLRLAAAAGLLFAGVERAPELVFATALASASANVVLHLVGRREVARVAVTDDGRAHARRLLGTAWPVGLGSLCAILYFHVDNLFLRAFGSDAALGHYNGAVRLLSFLIMVAQLASATALPWLVRRHAAGETGRALAGLGQPLFAAGALLAGLLTPVAGELLELCFTADFLPAAPSFRWLLAAAAVIHAGALLVTTLVAIGRVRAFLAVAAAGLAVNLVGNAWLVPTRGMEGAAIATLATETVVALGAALALRRAGVGFPRPLGWLGGPLAFALGTWLSGLVG